MSKRKIDDAIDDDCGSDTVTKKRRIERLFFAENLPDELLVRILALTYCKKTHLEIVCRQWLGIVSEPSFIRTCCIERWSEDLAPIRYEKASPDIKIKILEEYFIPLIQDGHSNDKVNWKRYYKIRSNFQKLGESLSPSSELARKSVFEIVIFIQAGVMPFSHYKLKASRYRAMKLLCDLARIEIEQKDISAADEFVLQNWNREYGDSSAIYNIKMCRCMFDLYFLAKSKGVNRLQLTMLRSIIDRFTASTLDLKVFTKILKELPHSEEATSHQLMNWFKLPEAQEKFDLLLAATKQQIEASESVEDKLNAIELSINLALQQSNPPFALVLFRLVSSISSVNAPFQEKVLMLIARLASQLNPKVTDENDFQFLLDILFRNEQILQVDSASQFYVGTAVLQLLTKRRAELFSENDRNLLNNALTGYKLHQLAESEQHLNCLDRMVKLSLFGPLLIPHLPQYDRFFMPGGRSNPIFIRFYLCDILAEYYPDEAVRRIIELIEQQTLPMLSAVLEEISVEVLKEILGDLWTDKLRDAVIEILLDTFPIEIREPQVVQQGQCSGSDWEQFPTEIFPAEVLVSEYVPAFEFPEIKLGRAEITTLMYLTKLAKKQVLSRSAQIQVLNVVVSQMCTLSKSSKQTEMMQLLVSMPMVSNDAECKDILPQLFQCVKYPVPNFDYLLLRLVNLHPGTVLRRLQSLRTNMYSVMFLAIIGSYFSVRVVMTQFFPQGNTEDLLKQAKESVRNKALYPVGGQCSEKYFSIMIHFIIQLHCSVIDPKNDTYCAYQASTFALDWSTMQTAMEDPHLKDFVAVYQDLPEDYPTTNFLMKLLPKFSDKYF